MSHSLGRYECKKVVGRGGMGEILLAYDPICNRNIAIKRIRQDLKPSNVLKSRFLHEAKVTSQLTHPGIISIYSIHQEDDELYYTMPYIEGETLKQVLQHSSQQNHHRVIGYGSIPALLPIFKSVCQTVAYAHSRGILHRDLKPENIFVGKFGEVIIFDWGLAQFINQEDENEEIATKEESDPILTSPGKLIGTVAYMAPEKVLGAKSSVQTDIYALGVILYQILTLHFPFSRPSMKEFCKSYKNEKFIEPEEVAPYREVPPRLSRMVKKSLESDPEERYQNMDMLLHDLISHMEGRSEWFEIATLNIKQKKHWEFQENVLISKHVAITRTTEAANWVSMMISRSAFTENIRIETRVQIGKSGAGIGFLLSVPEAAERENPLDGYCLWLGSDLFSHCQLFRNTIEVLSKPEVCLQRELWYQISIEKLDSNIIFTLNGDHQFTYISYIPLSGTHVGIITKDADFTMEPLVISSGSQNLQVSCLSIPDSFLANKDYKKALAEYRRIGYSFPGHAEGREALFRAGVTLLEQAKYARTEKKAEEYYTLALDEFSKLHRTPGAPLEYLGKALVYQSLKDNSEEIKCLELGLRRYKNHHLINAINEQILYRMHEAAQNDRKAAYQLILIVLRLLPQVMQKEDSCKLFKHLISHWERLYFLESSIEPSSLGMDKLNDICFAIPLAFWLSAPYILLEMYQELKKLPEIDSSALGDIIFSLFELGSYKMAGKIIDECSQNRELDSLIFLLKPLSICHQLSLKEAINMFFSTPLEDIGIREFRTAIYLIQFGIRTDQEELIPSIAAKMRAHTLSLSDQIMLDSYEIWAYLKSCDTKSASTMFEKYPLELLNQESTLLHSLYGCYLYITEGEEIANIHFAGVIDTSFPRSWSLLSHELTNKIRESMSWYNSSFMWERRQLYQQMILFNQCTDNSELESYYKSLEKEEYIYVE